MAEQDGEEAPIELLYVAGGDGPGVEALADAPGVALRTVPDAASALEVVTGRETVDCVVCPHDLRGVDLSTFVKQLRGGPPAPAALLVTDAHPSAVTAALEAGVTAAVRTSVPGWAGELPARARAAVERNRGRVEPPGGVRGRRRRRRRRRPRRPSGRRELRGPPVARPRSGGARRRVAVGARGDRRRRRPRPGAAAFEAPRPDRRRPAVDRGDLTGAIIDGDRRLLAVLRDVTERKRREQELRDERAFVDSVIDGLPDLLYTFDCEGNVLRWNDRVPEATGYRDEEIGEMDPLEFFPEDEHPRIAAAIAAVIHERERLTVESRVRREAERRSPTSSRARRSPTRAERSSA
jgi:PAS domain S-box-containing protein